MVVISNTDEQFLYERLAKYSNQKKLYQLKGHAAIFIKEAPADEGGFYFVTCDDYDDKIKIKHSHR